ncbi:ATPase/histidine kinase/DNA gyrase B/HSP90 domain protein [Aneurinibacillus aneurinilyticus ATCC 12856]|uniref:histidine kinase n=2 Tax=Aneurinibacillus aneurinilyticus TaxID=1391 RepID=U1X4C2_ANEAE|nr:ATPase/histidine kinase/DNA gyrase B/HSP90 domain protein [Aneurinibacillus aneurinilyticus ATCC 12856]
MEMARISEYRNTLLPLIIRKIPRMIEAHLQDMERNITNFQEAIGDIHEYAASLESVYVAVATMLFESEKEYKKCIQQIEEDGYEVGVYFGEVKEMNREVVLQLTHSIRTNSFGYVCDLINQNVPDPETRSLLTSRFVDILNTRFYGYINGFLFAKDKMITHLHNQKISIMGQMAAGMAHEIRNPLCSIKGFQQLIRQMAADRSESMGDFLNYIDICIEEITKVENLVSDFLLLARKNDTQKNRWETINLNELFKKVYHLSAYFVLEGSLDIRLSLPSVNIFVRGIPSYIEQIILNITKNSISAMDSGGVLLVSLSPSEDGKQVVLTFADNGVGIPERQLSKIFDPFFTTKEEGTGLGLCICKRLIEEMNGSINVQSKEKEGTVVEIRLPLVTSHK